MMPSCMGHVIHMLIILAAMQRPHLHTHNLVLYVPGSVGVFEGIQGLHEVSVSGADARYHECLAVAPERVL